MTVLRLANIDIDGLVIDRFSIDGSEAWCFYGSNRSGLSTLFRLLAEPELAGGGIDSRGDVAVLSFAAQQELYEEEVRRDQSDYLDRVDPGTPAGDFIREPERHRGLIEAFALQDCLGKGFRQLSSGESRKVLLIAAISAEPDLLVMENPYDGLDRAGCAELDALFDTLRRRGQPLLITVNNPGDIPAWCSHLAHLRGGRIVRSGRRDEVLAALAAEGEDGEASLRLQLGAESARNERRELVRLRNGCARYGGRTVFSGLQLDIFSGDHTLITGPNGCGKSTLLQMITGDNQNCYANDLSLFGRKRGSGESIWELKKEMGIVSPDLHRNHYIPGNALQVVLSGFFDSIGVYSRFSQSQKESAREWLAMVGLGDKSQTPFRRLSYADQRLCLIARGLIKLPRLLILDEPTQGLDQASRTGLLDFLELLAGRTVSTIVYASHRSDEFRGFFRQHIDMEQLPSS